MSCGYDPFKWADTFESIEDYLSEDEECLQQKNENSTSEEVTSQQ